MKFLASNLSHPTKEEIAEVAYVIWERSGRPEGNALSHWLEAETRLFELARTPAKQPAAAGATRGVGRYGLVLQESGTMPAAN